MELYYMIGVTGRKSAQTLVELCRELEMPLSVTNFAEGTATSEHLSLYDLQSTPKAVVSTVTGADGMKSLMRLAKQKLYMDIPGNGIMMAVPVKSVGGAGALNALTGGKVPEGGRPKMEFEYELIVVILNEGHSDTVMEAARSAGARGGTVLHAKGTGRTGTPKFFGASLAEEKDMIYIVAPSAEKSQIMRAIGRDAGDGSKAGAICFSLPISEVVGLRKFDEEQN